MMDMLGDISAIKDLGRKNQGSDALSQLMPILALSMLNQPQQAPVPQVICQGRGKKGWQRRADRAAGGRGVPPRRRIVRCARSARRRPTCGPATSSTRPARTPARARAAAARSTSVRCARRRRTGPS
jgi:hypothetical protein